MMVDNERPVRRHREIGVLIERAVGLEADAECHDVCRVSALVGDGKGDLAVLTEGKIDTVTTTPAFLMPPRRACW